METILRLGAIPGFGPARTRGLFRELAWRNEPVEMLAEFDDDDLASLSLDQSQIHAFRAVDTEHTLELLDRNSVEVITMMDADAPKSMRSGAAAPWYFVTGDWRVMNASSIGFSGSRDASPHALTCTKEISGASAARGWTVISGGARGVDTAAHAGALEAGGHTVIVLAQGILGWRPPDDFSVRKVVVISEFLPDDDWESFRAFQRNTSIIHLSDRLMVPQAGIKGGTMNTAEYALKIGHPTFVLDLGPSYPGNRLIEKMGATPFTWTGDASDLDMLEASPHTSKASQLPLM